MIPEALSRAVPPEDRELSRHRCGPVLGSAPVFLSAFRPAQAVPGVKRLSLQNRNVG